MKSIVVFIVTLFVAFNAFSHNNETKHELYGFGAFGISGLRENISSGIKTPLIGGALGLGYTYFFHPQWGVQSGFETSLYRITAEKSGNSSDGTGDVSVTEKLAILQIPLMVHFQTRSKSIFYMTGGFKIGFPVYDSYDIDLKTVYILAGEAGMKWKLNSRFSLYTGIYGDAGLNKMVDEVLNSNLQSGIGSSFIERRTIGALGLKIRLAFRLK